MSEINSRVMTHVDQALAGLQNELQALDMQEDASQVYQVRQQLKSGELDRQHNEIIHLQVHLRQAQEALETARKESYWEGFEEMKKRAKAHTHGWMLCYGPNVPETEVYRIIDQIGEKIQEEGENPITSI